MVSSRKTKIEVEALFGFRPKPDLESIIFDPTERTVVTVTHLFGDRK